MTTTRPNILIVMAEQFSGLIDPLDSESPVELPRLSAFARGATDFRRAYCNAPVCGPSRLSFLTGRYPCNSCGYDNGSILPPHMPTFGHLLTGAGYRTAICGRMHIHGLDQHRGFERRLASEIIDPREVVPALWPKQLLDSGPLPQANSHDYRQPFSKSPIHRHDEYVTSKTCQFLTQPHDKHKPFCLVTGFFDAHSGAAPNPEHEPAYQKYLKQDLPVSPFSLADYDRLPEHAKRFHHYAGNNSRVFDYEYHRHRLAAYFAGLEAVDEKFGRILDALDQSGQAKNTIVIFTADHGEMMGRHGLWGKMLFYEQSQRIPLYIRHPDLASYQSVNQLVSLVDILPTLAELTRAEKKESTSHTMNQMATFPVDGQSLVPLIEGNTPRKRPNTVFSEYHGHLSPCDMYMAVSKQYKLCHYTKEEDELYDLKLDPDETCNHIHNPAYEIQKDILMQTINHNVDIEAMTAKMQVYRQQRQASYDAIRHSEIAWERIESRNQKWRKQLDEPWWDGGEYLAMSEKPALR